MRLKTRSLAVVLLALCMFAIGCSDEPETRERGVGGNVPAEPIPGRPADSPTPAVGERIAAIGVPRGTTLDVHMFPGLDQAILRQAPPLTNGLISLAEAFISPDEQLWWLIQLDDVQGWIQPGAAFLGAPEDVAVEIVSGLSARSYESMEALSEEVVANLGDDAVLVHISDETEVGDVTSTIDVIEITERTSGFRFEISANSSLGGYRVSQALRIPLCTYEINNSGICV